MWSEGETSPRGGWGVWDASDFDDDSRRCRMTSRRLSRIQCYPLPVQVNPLLGAERDIVG